MFRVRKDQIYYELFFEHNSTKRVPQILLIVFLFIPILKSNFSFMDKNKDEEEEQEKKNTKRFGLISAR